MQSFCEFAALTPSVPSNTRHVYACSINAVLINKSTTCDLLNINSPDLLSVLYSIAWPPSFSPLWSPKVTYCHQLLPCCQSSSSNTLSAHWPWPTPANCRYTHTHTHTHDQRCTWSSHFFYQFLSNGFLLTHIIQHTHINLQRGQRVGREPCVFFYMCML